MLWDHLDANNFFGKYYKLHKSYTERKQQK